MTYKLYFRRSTNAMYVMIVYVYINQARKALHYVRDKAIRLQQLVAQ